MASERSGKDVGVFEQINNNIGNRQVKNVAIVMTEDSSIEDLGHRKAFQQTATGNEQNVPENGHGQEDKSNDCESNNESYNIFANDDRSSSQEDIFANNDSSSSQEVTDIDIAEISPLPDIRKLKMSFYDDNDVEDIDDLEVMRKTRPVMKKTRKCYKLSKQPSVPLSLLASSKAVESEAVQHKKAKVPRQTAKVPHAVKRLQDWNNKGDWELRVGSRRRTDNPKPNTQTEGDGELPVGETNTQIALCAPNSVEDQTSIGDQVQILNEEGSPGTSETATNIGQRSRDLNKSSYQPQITPEQSRPAEDLSENAVESHPITTQPPGTSKSSANCLLQEQSHNVTTTRFSHLARFGITVTPVRSSARNSDSNVSGSTETAGRIHRSQRNEPVIHKDDGAIGQQGNLSVKIGSGNMTVRNGEVTVEMKCTDVEISGQADDVLKLVTKFKPSFGALE